MKLQYFLLKERVLQKYEESEEKYWKRACLWENDKTRLFRGWRIAGVFSGWNVGKIHFFGYVKDSTSRSRMFQRAFDDPLVFGNVWAHVLYRFQIFLKVKVCFFVYRRKQYLSIKATNSVESVSKYSTTCAFSRNMQRTYKRPLVSFQAVFFRSLWRFCSAFLKLSNCKKRQKN